MDYVGYVASAVSVTSWLAGTVSALSGKSKGPSIAMFTLSIVANSLWLTYGISKKAIPVVVSSSLIAIMGSIVVIVLVRKRRLAAEKKKLQDEKSV
jgi:uncharacterized protein with PQ loop repeat